MAAITRPSENFVNQSVLRVIIETLSLLTFVVGLAGYQADIIQLGLDQLFEAPSQYLGLLIHYAFWALNSGMLLVLILTVIFCVKQTTLAKVQQTCRNSGYKSSYFLYVASC